MSWKQRIISTGYNGTPRGIKNCFEGGCPRCAGDSASGSNLSDCICAHAEENSIVQAAFHGISVRGGTLYSTISPCLMCAKMIINAGLKEVVYEHDYRFSKPVRDLFRQAGVKCRQFKRKNNDSQGNPKRNEQIQNSCHLSESDSPSARGRNPRARISRSAGIARRRRNGGRFEDCMKLNLWLRTGHRVLRLVKTFQARHADELYAQVSQIPWEQHIREDGYLSVMSSVENPTIRDTRFASLRCKDAIVDRIKKERDRRPDSGPLCEGVVVFLYWRQNECAIYFDTSGEPLSKRGYRKIPLQAPMQETLAAAVVLAAGWRGDRNFVNPMCGSGTLAIEAALIGLGRAPGLTRGNFAFMHLKEFNGVRGNC